MCLNFLCFSSDLCNANLNSTVLAFYFLSGRSLTHALHYVSFIKTLTSCIRLKYLLNLFLLNYGNYIFLYSLQLINSYSNTLILYSDQKFILLLLITKTVYTHSMYSILIHRVMLQYPELQVHPEMCNGNH